MIAALEAAAGRPVSRETFGKIERYVALLRAASAEQNLVSRSTLDGVWDRHILDSAQLVRFEPRPRASWLDIGSGAGLPGIIIACLVEGQVTLVEPRKLRAQFLAHAVDELRIRAQVVQGKVEGISGQFDVITARAVAPLARLLGISHHLSTRKTLWVLPKGRNARSELAVAQSAWQGTFHVEPSVTDADSFIIVGTGVRARGR